MSGDEGDPELNRDEALGLLRTIPQGVAVLDETGTLFFLNDACAELHGWPSASALEGRSWRELFEPEEADRLQPEGLAAARKGRLWRGDATGRRHDGLTFPEEVVFAPLASGRVALLLSDRTEEERVETQMKELVYRDPLTGLPNRRLFDDRLAIALAQAHRYRHRLAVIFVDLDHFKQINDTLGHAAGDELLRAVARRLTECVREGDTVARRAGDEFSLLLPGIHYAEDVATISRKLSDALRQPFPVDGHDVRVTSSGGVALYPEDGESEEALLRSADTAMYRAKEHGRDNFQLFSPAMAEKALERRTLEEGLRQALEKREMTLHYQPCLDTGVLLAVGSWALDAACQQAREWQRRGSPKLRMMVNMSAYELQQPDLVVNVEKALAASGLEPDTLHLEIPEGYAMQNIDRAIGALRALRDIGVHLAIDGFGTGFSSLAHLRRLPVDALKIDLSFVRGATTDPDDASLVTAVIAVAHSLGLRVVAQGVETEAQVTLLRSLGCDEVQGFLWSPPVPAAECEPLITAGVLPVSDLSREGSGRPARRRRKSS